MPLPVSVPPAGFLVLNFGCDLCVQSGQSVTFTTLDCTPDTRRLPTFCTIHNPDGLTARDLDDGAAYVSGNDQLTITNVVSNPEDPAPPTVLGDWTCTCVNENGMSTETSRIGECRELVSFSRNKSYSLMLSVVVDCLLNMCHRNSDLHVDWGPSNL